MNNPFFQFFLDFKEGIADLVDEEIYMDMLGEEGVNISEDNAYVMKSNQYLKTNKNLSFGITSSFTIGFWLSPVDPGFVYEEHEGDLNSIKMPILDLYDGGDKRISIFENTNKDNLGYNYLTVYLKDDINEYMIFSETYDTEKEHYFFIIYDGDKVDIYIDGEEKNDIDEGVFISSIDIINFDFYINWINSFDSNTIYNYGHIKDIFISNQVGSKKDMQSIINYSAKEFFNYHHFIDDIETYSIVFHDPHTIKINSVIDDMSYLYLSSNNGSIYKGSLLLWESRKDFTNLEEQDYLDEYVHHEEDVAEAQNGFLKITNSTIRI